MTIFTIHCFKQRAWKISGLLAVLIVVGSAPVWAQGDWDMQNRIKRLENEIDTLSRAVYRGEKPPPGSFSGGGASSGGADVEVRLQQIETEMRDLRGQLERQSFEIRQMKDQLERFTSDMELRMNDLESHGGGQRSGSAGASSGMLYTVPSSVNTGASTDSAGQGAGPTYQWSSSNNNAAEAGQLGSYNATGDSGGGDLAAATYENAFAMVKNRQYKAAQTEFESFYVIIPIMRWPAMRAIGWGKRIMCAVSLNRRRAFLPKGIRKIPRARKPVIIC